jgi:hypothetical membrane protein
VSTHETLPPKHRILRQVAGVCGILGVIVFLSFVGLAIFYSPGNFSITQNWISDLGGMGYTAFENVSRPLVTSSTTALLFDSGLAVAGILGIIFSLGLLSDANSPAYRLGAVCTLLGAAAIAGVGLLPEPLGVIHIVVSFAFGIFFAAAMFLIGGSLVDSSAKPLGGFSIALGIVALVGTSLISYERGVAESILAAAIALWFVVFSIRMLRRTSLSET